MVRLLKAEQDQWADFSSVWNQRTKQGVVFFAPQLSATESNSTAHEIEMRF
jgi:hypothetical protein